MTTWRTVSALALALPGAMAATCYGMPAFKVGGKVFATQSSHAAGALVVRVPPRDRQRLIAAHPDLCFVTPHYQGHPYLLLRWARTPRAFLRERLEESWLLAAPPTPGPSRNQRRNTAR